MSKTLESKFEYASESELLAQFHHYMKDPKNVEDGTNYLYESLVDEIILGVVFEMHHAHKSGQDTLGLDAPSTEDSSQFKIVDAPDVDVFGSSHAKKAIDCTCPNCDRLVACSRFAPHLEKCMGMGRNSSRISRRIANSREGTNSAYFTSGQISDDEEQDADWSGEKQMKNRKKMQPIRPNGGKKNGKSS